MKKFVYVTKVVYHGKSLGCHSIMEDAMGLIQETGQEQRPARMVGLSSLDLAIIQHGSWSGNRACSRGKGSKR